MLKVAKQKLTKHNLKAKASKELTKSSNQWEKL